MSQVNTPVSEEQMQAAYDRIRQPDWPSYADLKRHALLLAQVRGAANRRVNAAPSPVHTCAQRAASSQPVPQHPPIFDAKRAAAGERPDDE